MKKQPRKINRREFLRMAGFAGASLAGLRLSPLRARRASPGEADAAGRPPRPWWVRTVEQPTVEIDWQQMQRFDARKTARGAGFVRYVGEEEALRLSKIAAENERQRMLEGVPGYSLRDQALRSAQHFDTHQSLRFLGPRGAPTPQQRGVPRWETSPTEAARTLRAAMRHFGAATIGFVALNENTRKLIYSHDPDGKRIEFEAVEEAYETPEKRVIPYRARWVIVYTVQMSTEAAKRAPTVIAAQNTSLAYNRAAHIQSRTQEFLRGLGYQCLGESSVNALGIAPAFAVLAGLGELSRLNRLITPEFGPMVRVFKMVTDLPLATDKPIDAGIIEFCKHCKKCAEACPPGALSFEDEPVWEVRGGWNNPGHKAYFEDSVKCRTYWQEVAGSNCGICFAVCPFSKKDKVWLHQWVKATISQTEVLDSFFRSMDDAFSYGAQKDPEVWWRLNLPPYGLE